MSQPNSQAEYAEVFKEIKKKYPNKTDGEIINYIEEETDET